MNRKAEDKAMGLAEITLISLGLSLDVFAYCLYKGAMLSELKKSELAKMITVFTVFQIVMMVAGNLITYISAIRAGYEAASRLWERLAGVIFLILGVYMLIKAFVRRNRKISEAKQDEFNYHVIAFWALLTSVDALIAGVGFGFLGAELIAALLIVGAVTVLCAFSGIIAGYRLGCGPMNKFVAIGGGLVLIGGLEVMLHFLI
jgi:putative Mn2+ efflux pump MntP